MAKRIKAVGKAEVEIKPFKEGYIMTALRIPLRFKKLSDGWIKDFVLGIDWGPSSDKTMKWEDAKKYCASLGGRLPARFELVSLIDDTKHHPAINPIFADTKIDDWYWSGTTHAGSPGCARIVNFGNGLVNAYHKSSSGYVRPVRASQ